MSMTKFVQCPRSHRRLFVCVFCVPCLLSVLINCVLTLFRSQGRYFPYLRPGRAHGVRVLERPRQAGGGQDHARDRQKGDCWLLLFRKDRRAQHCKYASRTRKHNSFRSPYTCTSSSQVVRQREGTVPMNCVDSLDCYQECLSPAEEDEPDDSVLPARFHAPEFALLALRDVLCCRFGRWQTSWSCGPTAQTVSDKRWRAQPTPSREKHRVAAAKSGAKAGGS